jgi:hypothetical protein
VIAAALMVPAFDAPAPEVDEGILTAYPARMLDGGLPHRDYYDPYGPGSVWTIAAADELVGPGLDAERGVGMVYRLALIVAVFVLALAWGLPAAIVSGLTAAALLVSVVAANAVVGVHALALLGLGLLVHGLLRTQPGRRRDRLLVAGGALMGASLLMRYDFAPAVILAALPLALAADARDRRRIAVGFAAGLAPLAIHVAIVGPHAFVRSARIALESRPGHPARPPFGSDLAEYVALYALGTALFLGAGAWLERRRGRDLEARALLGIGLYGLALVPFALSILDIPHVLFASLPVVAPLTIAASVLARGDAAQRTTRAPQRAFAAAAVAVVVFFVAPSAIRVPVYHQARYLLTGRRDPVFVVSNDGRAYRLAAPDVAHDVQAMLGAVDRLARPGDSLFVGPQDLRTTGANDVFLYYLLPKLEPASYFMEVDLHTIDRPRNGFVRELRRADWLILTTRWTGAVGPKGPGPAAPNDILASRFCARASSGTYRLYQRCR